MATIPASDVDLISYYPLPDISSVKDEKTGKVKWTVKLKDPGGTLVNNKEMNDWVTELKNDNEHNTTCCIQMSHAINMMFHLRDVSKMVGPMTSGREARANKKIANAAAANKFFYYIRSVNEMKDFLTETFEEGECISGEDGRKPVKYQDQVALITGRTGIRGLHGREPFGRRAHGDLDGSDFHQAIMKGFFSSLEKSAPVWFWEVRLDASS